MADLSNTTTDKRLSFTKYVTDNKRYSEIEFEIEKDRSTFVFKKVGQALKPGKIEYKTGTKLKIIDTKFYVFSGIKYALVKLKSESGYIPIKCIRKPTGGNGTQYEDEIIDAINSYIKKMADQLI